MILQAVRILLTLPENFVYASSRCVIHWSRIIYQPNQTNEGHDLLLWVWQNGNLESVSDEYLRDLEEDNQPPLHSPDEGKLCPSLWTDTDFPKRIPWVRDWLKSSVPMWLYLLYSFTALTSPSSTCADMCPYFQKKKKQDRNSVRWCASLNRSLYWLIRLI